MRLFAPACFRFSQSCLNALLMLSCSDTPAIFQYPHPLQWRMLGLACGALGESALPDSLVSGPRHFMRTPSIHAHLGCTMAWTSTRANAVCQYLQCAPLRCSPLRGRTAFCGLCAQQVGKPRLRALIDMRHPIYRILQITHPPL